MKLTLKEVRRLVETLLIESVCTKCGFDNPFMDDDPNYVCRQCKSRMDKWGGGSPFSKDSHGQEDESWNTCSTCGHELSPDGPGCAQDPNCDCDSCLNGEGPDSIEEWDCARCGTTGIYNDHGTCGKCGAPKP